VIGGAELLNDLSKLPQFTALDPTTARNLRAWIGHPSGDLAKAVQEFYPGMSTEDRYLIGAPLFHNAGAMTIVDEAHRLDAIRRRRA
jgi:hypothetical protein